MRSLFERTTKQSAFGFPTGNNAVKRSGNLKLSHLLLHQIELPSQLCELNFQLHNTLGQIRRRIGLTAIDR